MAEPWKVNFPVVTDPVSKEKLIVLVTRTIKDIRPGVSPTMIEVLGMARSGRHICATIPKEEWERANLAPMHFVAADDIRGPTGSLVNLQGKALSNGG